jgi:mannose-6-phosphate isomerase
MDEKYYGGNKVKVCLLDKSRIQVLGNGPYEYFIYKSLDTEVIKFNSLLSYSVFILEKPDYSQINFTNLGNSIIEGDCVQVEGVDAEVSVKGGSVKLLVSGTKDPHPDHKGVFYIGSDQIYRVNKPWGHELWINNQHPCYAFKEIYIKQGYKTSLQYHRFKQETNVLLKGKALLHYKNNIKIENDYICDKDISFVELNSISIINIQPNTIHRLEALTDILLYETSTPNLDDVVRLVDDSGRPSGRIDKEHSN